MARRMIGIDLGGTFIKAGVVDDEGKVLSRVKKPTDTEEGRQTIIHNIAAAVVEARDQAGVPWRSICAVGLGSPGIFEQPSGIVSQSPNLPALNGQLLAPPVMKAAGHPEIPIILENDANVAAFAEAWIGCARGVGTMALMTLGTGIGGGIVLNGEIWRGFRGTAGEVGHMNLFPTGTRCGCGNRGCLEAYASAPALVRRFKKAVRDGKPTGLTARLKEGEPVTARDISDAAVAGDALCLALMEETGRFLGIGVMNLLHVLNIELVAFTGGMTAAGDLLLDAIRNEARQRTLRLAIKGVKIVFSRMGNDAGLIGAAGWALRRTRGLRLGGRA
jgi:glucokinase